MLGAGGQLGRDLVPQLRQAGHHVVAAGRREVDVADRAQVAQALEVEAFDRVVNCAAYTAVDRAESEPELAYSVNRDGAEAVAVACAREGVALCHLSTDFVFGQSPPQPGRPWEESDQPQPRGVYALSKWEGELACQAAGGRLQLVRTAWLYGSSGPNFPLAICRAAARGRPLLVVSDQSGSPTWTGHLAVALEALLRDGSPGTYHLTGGGSTSWYGFAQRLLERLGLNADLTPVSTAEWGAPAPRPVFSVLANRAWADLGGEPIPDWEQGLAGYLDREREGAVAAALSGADG